MPIGSDALLETIQAFNRGGVLFNETPSDLTETIEDQIIAATYGPPMLRLEDWNEPAKSLDAAIAALRLALKDLTPAPSGLAHPMVAAALGYLETLEQRREGANVVPLFTPETPS